MAGEVARALVMCSIFGSITVAARDNACADVIIRKAASNTHLRRAIRHPVLGIIHENRPRQRSCVPRRAALAAGFVRPGRHRR